jgi:glycosyltransferase involved in cell wall biosynthesis
MRIVAVVVTYNRKELLQEALAAIRAQTRPPDSVVVVDNQSTDGTAEVMAKLAEPGYLYYERLESNLGGAGGFNRGMRRAYELGADWLWCMDDDCVAEPTALERLLDPLGSSEIRERTGYLASRVLWVDRSPCLMNLPVAHWFWIQPFDDQPQLTRIVGSSLVSMLVSRTALERVGLPVKEFFVWFDDAEFSRRISSAMPAYLVRDSVVLHKTPTNLAPLDFRHLDAKSLWKFRLGVRNECAFHRRTGGWRNALVFCARMMIRLRRARVRPRLAVAIATACLEGFRFNYPSLIEFPVDTRSGISPGRAAAEA